LGTLNERGAVVKVGQPVTVKQLAYRFLDQKKILAEKGKLAPETIRNYTYRVEKLVIPAIGNRVAAKCADSVIQEVYDYALSVGVSESTAKDGSIMAGLILGITMRDARRAGFDGIGAAPARSRVLSEKEIAAILGELFRKGKPYRHRFIIAFILNTGIRAHEALGLRVKDESDGQILIERQLYRENGGAAWSMRPVKGKQARVLPLNDEAKLILEAAKNQIQLDRKRMGYRHYEDNGLLFPTSAGRPDYREHVLGTLQDIAQRLKMPQVTLHDLRRTYITYLAHEESNMLLVQRLAGHRSEATTRKHYIGTEMNRLKAAAGRISFKIRQEEEDPTAPLTEDL
jgi:integrase